MEETWMKTHWKKEDLDGKTVDFAIRMDSSRLVGKGRFTVSEDMSGELHIEIEISDNRNPPSFGG